MLRNPAKSRFPFVKSPMPPAKKAVNSTWLLVGKISYFFVLLTTSGSKHPHRCYTYMFPRFAASLSGRGVSANSNSSQYVYILYVLYDLSRVLGKFSILPDRLSLPFYVLVSASLLLRGEVWQPQRFSLPDGAERGIQFPSKE